MFCCPSFEYLFYLQKKYKIKKNLLINNNLLSTSPMTKNLEHVSYLIVQLMSVKYIKYIKSTSFPSWFKMQFACFLL